MNVHVVDLFCGVGGLTHGFIKEGFSVLAGFDSDVTCKYAYEKNNHPAKFNEKDVRDVTGQEIKALYPTNSIKILVGCAPCQPFSSYTNSQPETRKNWSLLSEFARLIEQVEPDIVSMENVPRLQSFKGGDILRTFTNSLENCGYQITLKSIYCPDYGIPQSRTRLVLLASKRGKIEIEQPEYSPEMYKTVGDIIRDLPPIKAGEIHPDDPLHCTSKLSDKNLQRISHSKSGGTWHDWPEELIADCHKKRSGRSYVSVYGRMSWDTVAPTITTQCNGFGNGRFGHPEQDRAISLREAALLQTFPMNYDFLGESITSIQTIAKHIGNAVPVQLGQVIARSIRKHLETHYVR